MTDVELAVDWLRERTLMSSGEKPTVCVDVQHWYHGHRTGGGVSTVYSASVLQNGVCFQVGSVSSAMGAAKLAFSKWVRGEA